MPKRSSSPVDRWLPVLRCNACEGRLAREDDSPEAPLRCLSCAREYAVSRGTLRMNGGPAGLSDPDARRRTAQSFGFEWQRFGAIRDEWEQNFLDYMQPHGPGFFRGLRVLDAGTGSGRHSRQAALYGAEVAAIDLGPSIDVARENVPSEVLTVQSDLEAMPFEPGTFDFVMSIGVLHHLPDTAAALRYLARFARPGGLVRVYLYWEPETRWHRPVLRLVTALRRITTRLPHRLLAALCYPLAAALWIGVVTPHRTLRTRPRGRRLARALPLQTYADYPFGVLVNDQFDRFSAPIERRFSADAVESMMKAAGLTDVRLFANAGWVAEGTVPG